MLHRRHYKPWLCDVLYDTEARAYLLDVLCGGIASFTVRIRLTAEEAAEFERDPSSADRLAFTVAKDHERYRSRVIAFL